MESEHQVPIWFFIGAILLVYGVIVLGAGLYNLAVPPEKPLALAHLHAGIWWGVLLIVVGAIYCVRFNPLKRQE